MKPLISLDGPFSTEASRACLEELRRLARRPDSEMERHCQRVIEVAAELGRLRGTEVDGEVLACAGWLHDVGLYPEVATADAYVADGRRVAERVLEPFGWPGDRVRLVGDAIECHHELRAQWSRGAEVELMRRADMVDVSGGLVRFGLDRTWLRELFGRIPRDGMYMEIGRLLRRGLRTRPGSFLKIFLRG